MSVLAKLPPGKFSLRWYQSEAIDALYSFFATHKEGNPLLAIPTGGGKSLIIAEFIRSIFHFWPYQRVVMLTHVKELIRQNYEEIKENWPAAPVGIYSAGLNRRELMPVTFAGIQSIADKAHLLGHVDLVIIDEAHLVPPSDDARYTTFLSDLKAINPRLRVIGLTATPFRLSQGRLTEPFIKNGKTFEPIFTHTAYDICTRDAFNRLIREGYLCPLIPKHTRTQIDTSEVNIKGGEFVLSELQRAADRQEITFAAIEELCRLGVGRKKWLIFGTGTEHCEHIVSALEHFGIKAACITSSTPAEERDRLLKAYASDELQALVSNNILTTGFNEKRIDLIGVLRPTQSPSLWVQLLGRGTRPFPGKENCLVLDFAGNTRRLGPINDPVLPTKRRKGSASGPSVAPVRICPHCATYNPASARVCVSCYGLFPPPSVKINAEASTDALIAGAPPIQEVFKVERVEYKKHVPHFASGKPPSLKIEYFCGLRVFRSFLCLEHDGYPRKLAREFWRNAANDWDTEPPEDVDEAMNRIPELQRPTHVKVWLKETPQVMAVDYSGSAFSSEIPTLNN